MADQDSGPNCDKCQLHVPETLLISTPYTHTGFVNRLVTGIFVITGENLHTTVSTDMQKQVTGGPASASLGELRGQRTGPRFGEAQGWPGLPKWAGSPGGGVGWLYVIHS